MTTKITTSNIESTTLTSLGGPKVASIVYPGTETATDTNGGETITLNGTGFLTSCNVLVGSTSASVVTFVSSTQISFTAPAMSAGTYVIYVINTDGGTAISIPGISYSGTPNWTTTAGSLGTAYETGSISATLAATGDAPITYTLASGTLPTGSSLASNGTLSGTAPATASATTYNFTITAKDAQNQTTNRAFSLTINPDVVTWSSPASLTTYNVNTNTAIANVTMSATSAAGGSITYTADTLPTGLSITGANIAGTPTVAASTTTVLTATATSTRTATRTINWVVSVANDTYWKNTTLLLNGETTNTPFISDASTNSFGLTINGDTKPVLFNPYQGDGYYGVYFGGTGNYLTTTGSSIGSSNYTVEAWIYPTSLTTISIFSLGTSDATGSMVFYVSSDGSINLYADNASRLLSSASIIKINQWQHVALVRNGTTSTIYVNGVSVASSTNSYTPTSTAYQICAGYGGLNTPITGYISNLRVVNGTAVYTSAFTPSTTPLTAIANTALLTCQSNRFVDKSTNAYTLTVTGSPQISPAIPFTANSSYSTYGSTYFDGSGDYLSTPYNISLLPVSGTDFTAECWIYITGATAVYAHIIGMNSNSAVDWTIKNENGILQGQIGGTYGNFGTAVVNTWVHLALVQRSNSVYGYMNGVQSFTSSIASWTNNNLAMTIGARTGTIDRYFTGYIADVRVVKGTAVYTSAFTPPTTPLTAIANTSLLTLQYNGGANDYGIIDNSNFNNIITRAGNSTQGTFSPYSQTGWSNYFNGSNTGLDLPGSIINSMSGTWTIEAWCYMTVAPSGMAYSSSFGLLSGANGTSSAWHYFGIGSIGIVYLDRAGGSYYSYTTTISVPSVNTWFHIALVNVGTTVSVYFNGASAGSFNNTGTWDTQSSQTQIGHFNSASYFPGYISNLRVVNGTAVYTGAFTPSTTPLKVIANTTLLTCQSNRFIDNSPNNSTVTPLNAPQVQAYSPFGSISEATPITYSNYFNGSTDYLTTPVNTATTFGTGDFTIEAWVYMTASFAQNDSIVSIIGDWQVSWNTGGFVFMPDGATRQVNTSGYAVMNTGTWYHVAFTRQGTSLRSFLNGNLAATATSTANFNSATDGARIGISRSTGYFTGYISNLRLVKGVAQYTSTFTPSTTPLTAVSGTGLLTCQSSTIVDNSSNALTITASGSPKVYKYNPFGYTAQSVTSYTPSIHGGSIYHDGTGDYITSTSSSFAFGASNDFTAECWVYFTTLNSSQSPVIISVGNSGTSTGWQIYADSNNGWGVRSNVANVFSTANPPKINQWYHVAYVRKSGTHYLFVNGVLNTTTSTSSYTWSDTVFYSGQGGLGNNFYGYVSDVRLINGTGLYTSNFVPPTQTLTNYSTNTPSALLLNFTNGGIIDQHSSNVLETLTGTQLSTSIKKYNNASLSFNGANYVSLPSSPLTNFGTGDFTFEFWVYPTTTIPAYTKLVTGSSLTFTIETQSTDNKLWVTYYDGTILGSTTALSNNVWTHFAAVRSSGTLTLYVNGTASGSVASSYNFGSFLYIGGRPSSQYFTGYMDDIRATKGYARYTSNFTAPTSALITK